LLYCIQLSFAVVLNFFSGCKVSPVLIGRSANSSALTVLTGIKIHMKAYGRALLYSWDGYLRLFVKRFKVSPNAHPMRNLQHYGTVYYSCRTIVANYMRKPLVFPWVSHPLFWVISEILSPDGAKSSIFSAINGNSAESPRSCCFLW
jgi:hypothetical protein